MRNLVLITFIFLLSINSLFAQKREHIRVVPKLSHSYVLPLKHNKRDSLYHTRPQLKYIYLRHKNQHIDDPIVRYALDNLKKERVKYYELYKAINTLSDYAENEHIKYMLNYVRNYFETVQAKEEAIRQIEDRIKRDSVDFYKEHPEDSVQYDKLLNQDLKALLSLNVYQYQKYSEPKEIVEECLLEAPDSMYFVLSEMKIGKITKRCWMYYSDVTFSFGQGFISSNWASGGENSLSILSDIKYFATYKKNNTTWENSIRYRLGALKSGSEDLSKNEDKLELQSKLGIKAFKHWNYATQFDMNTVLFKTKNNPDKEVIAAFLTPGNFTLSLGLDYKPKNNISLYLSPIAGQWVYMRDTNLVAPSRYGLEIGKKFKSDAGAKIELKNQHELFKFLKIDNHLIIFSSYYEQPEKLTLDWRLTLNFKINYFMQTSVYANAVYNQNDSKKIQLKQTLNLGVYFRF